MMIYVVNALLLGHDGTGTGVFDDFCSRRHLFFLDG